MAAEGTNNILAFKSPNLQKSATKATGNGQHKDNYLCIRLWIDLLQKTPERTHSAHTHTHTHTHTQTTAQATASRPSLPHYT